MDRFSGFWWAPDSQGLAFCAVDEGAVPPYAITHQVSSSPTHNKTEILCVCVMSSGRVCLPSHTR